MNVPAQCCIVFFPFAKCSLRSQIERRVSPVLFFLFSIFSEENAQILFYVKCHTIFDNHNESPTKLTL